MKEETKIIKVAFIVINTKMNSAETPNDMIINAKICCMDKNTQLLRQQTRLSLRGITQIFDKGSELYDL